MPLIEVIKINGSDKGVGLIEEASKATPEFNRIPSRTIKGVNYKTLVRTTLPNTTAGFRAINAGVAPTRSQFENRLVEAFPLEAVWHIDALEADSAEDGREALMELEATGQLEGQLQAIGRQIYYGTGAGGNSLGFPGLIQAHDATNMVVDAAGTTDNVASSAWLVCFGPRDVQWVWGMNGNIRITPTGADLWNKPVRIPDPADATKSFAAYQQALLARVGLAVHSAMSVVRIKKLTTDTGKGLTDALIADGLAKFPVGKRPDAIFCSRRSASQLQKSRSVTIMTGPDRKVATNIEAIADTPTEAFGIPIVVTDSISNTETLAL